MTAALLLLIAASSQAQEPVSHAKAELISEQGAVRPGKTFSVALRLTMKDGWHTYWRNPGDSGKPTSVEWALPPGFTASAPRWTYPERFSSGPAVTYGYAQEAALIFDLKAPVKIPARAVLKATAKWLECKDVCVPGHAQLSLKLPAKKDPGFAALRAKLPVKPGKGWDVRAFRDDGRIRLRVAAPAGAQGFIGPWGAFNAAFFPYRDSAATDNKETTIRTDGQALVLELPQAGGKAKRLAGVLVLKHQGRAFEISAPIETVGP